MPVLQQFACKTVVDIGANRGQFALAARNAWPDCRIFSFEPLEEAGRIYSGVFKNDPKVKLFPFAIGNRREEALFHVSQEDDSSSLLPISEQQTRLFPGTKEKETRSVQVVRLSDVLAPEQISHPSLLKIDVQGYEWVVLQGSEDLLNSFDYIYIECSFIELYQGQALAHQVIDFLQHREFYLYGVYNLFHEKTGRAVQADFLFRKGTAN